MGRLEEFKKDRRLKKRFVALTLLCFIISVAGIYVVDYSMNSLMGEAEPVRVASIKNVEGKYIEVSLIDKKFYVNIKYLNRDYAKISETIKERGTSIWTWFQQVVQQASSKF